MKISRSFFKFVFAFGGLFFALNRTYAQYSFSPSTTLIKNQGLNLMVYDSIHIANTSTDTIDLNWKLLINDTLYGTYFDFCSSGNCWLGIPDSGSFPPIEPGGFGWAGAHFWTGNIPRTSTAKIWVYEKGNPTTGDTLTFILIGHLLGINDHYENKDLFSAVPNPTRGMVHVTSSTHTSQNISVINSLGEHLHSTSGNFIDLSVYPNGIYFIEIRSKAGLTSKKILLNK